MNRANVIHVCPEFGKFVEQGWRKPNKEFLHNYSMARGQKKQMLIDQVGHLGLVIDILMRASITEMLVKFMFADAKQIVSKRSFLKKHMENVTNDNRVIAEIQKWFNCKKATHDFTLCYRAFRMKLLASQLFTLVNAPKALVSNELPHSIFIIILFIESNRFFQL